MKATSLLFLASLVASTAALTGCTKKKAPAPETQPSASASLPAAPIDAGLMGRLQAIASGCVIQEDTAVLGECKAQEAPKLAADFRRGTVKHADALPTLVEALFGTDGKLRAVATNTLYTSYRTSFGDAKPGDVSVTTAERLERAALTLDERLGGQLISAATHAAFLSGRGPAFLTTLDQAPERIRREGFRYLMTYGRMAAFSKIKAVVAGSDIAQAVNAIESVRTFESLIPAEKKEVCLWAKTLLVDSRSQVVGKAGSVLIECGDGYVEALLEEGQKRIHDKTFDAPFARAFSFGCLKTNHSEPKPAETPTCSATRKLLESAMTSKDVSAGAKVPVLMSLARQWPDERTKKLVAKYKTSEHKTLAMRAKSAEQRVDAALKRAAEKKKADAEAAKAASAKSSAVPKPAGVPTPASTPQKPGP